MATYGSGQMLGSGINPESFKQDYSGFTRAAEMQAQGIAGLGASIGGAIEDYGKMKKQQQEDERAVQKSKNVAKAIGDLIPDLKPTIQNSLTILENKELPLSQRKAEAEAIADILNLGIGEIRNRQDIGLKERGLKIQEDEVAARNAPPPPSFDFKEVAVPYVVNGVKGTIRMLEDANSGRVRTSDGKEYSNIEDAKAGRNPIRQVSSGIDAALELPMPTPEQPNIYGTGTSVGGGPGVLPNAIASAAEMPDGQGNLANASPVPVGSPTVTQQPKVDGPPGFTPDEVKPVEQKTTSRIITGEEAKTRLGGDPNKRYNIEEKGKEITRFVEMPPDITPTEQRAIDEDKGKKLESKMAASAVIKTIDKFIDQNGNSNENLKSAVGYGEGLATGVSKYAPILGTQSPQNRADQKELRILVEKGLLEAAKDLKPISNTDLKLLLTNRPEITDPPELWSEFLNNLRSILNDPNSYLGSNAETQSNATPNTATPQSATEGLRALLPPQ